MADQFNPFKTGPLYDRHCPRWRMEIDFAEPTADVFAAGIHLAKFSAKEQDGDYDYRRSMSCPLDMIQDAINVRVENIWRKPVQRDYTGSPYAAIIEGLVHDADGDGTTLDNFMRGVLWAYYVSGCDIVTQMTASRLDRPIATRADEQEAGLRPYWLRCIPLDRYDWATTGSGSFLWARYCLGMLPRTDEQGADEQITEFLTLTGTEWRRHFARRGSSIDPRPEVVNTISGTHSFGRPPIIKAYFAESQRTGQAGVPISLISRAALIAKVALNLKSQADAELLAAVPRWMFNGPDAPPDTYGPGTLFHSKDPESKLAVVQGDVSHIAEKRVWLLLYLSEILRLLKFRGGMGEVEGNQGSGVKLALEMTDLQNELRATASFMETLEVEMMRQAISMYTGKVVPAEDAADTIKYEVQYNRDFILEPVETMLANIKTFVSDCSAVADEVPEITKEMLRQLTGLLVRPESPTSEIINEQIDEADLEGFKPAGPPPIPPGLPGNEEGAPPQNDEGDE